MNRKLAATFTLAITLAGVGGFAGARALDAAAAEKKTHLEADSLELDRTAKFLDGHIDSAVMTLKQLAKETTAENIDAKKQERERAINAAMAPLTEDSGVLTIQGHLLCLDNIADQLGEPAEQFIQQAVFSKLDVDSATVAKRREATGLGNGSLILGYAIAKVSKAPADDVFKMKDGKSWPEVMRAKNVTLPQIMTLLDNKDQ